MKVMVTKQSLVCIESFTRSREPLNLYGLVRKNEKLAYVMQIGKPCDDLPVIGQLKSNCLMPDGYDIFGLLKDNEVIFYHRDNGQWYRSERVIVDLDDSYARTPFPRNLLDVLGRSRVALFGQGSVGSRIALGLVRSGVVSFKLVDPDRFAIENVSRHECDLRDLGRYKVNAMKERILMVNPMAKVEPYSFDIFKKNEKVGDKVFAGLDLVIASTDRRAVQLRINDKCFERGTPALFVGCYDEARAGETLFVIPGETSMCYECLRGGTTQQEKPRQYDYSQSLDSEAYKGEPGLNASINFITDVAEHQAIALLLRKEDCEMAKLIDPERNLLFIGGALGKGFYYLKDTHCFKRPFEFIFPMIKGPWKECETCQGKRNSG